MGEVIRNAWERGAKKVVIGSGGSAFVDGGFGAMTVGMGVFRPVGSHGEDVKTLLDNKKIS